MAKVAGLLPGERITLGTTSAIYIAQTAHPVYPGLQLVLWRMDDGTWHHDALNALQDVGEPEPATPEEREENLRRLWTGSAG